MLYSENRTLVPDDYDNGDASQTGGRRLPHPLRSCSSTTARNGTASSKLQPWYAASAIARFVRRQLRQAR